MTRVPILLTPFLLSCLVAGSACASTIQDDDNSVLRRAEAAHRSGDYPTAVALFSDLTERRPASPAVCRALVRTLGEVGRYREAEIAARKFIAADSSSPELWNALGEVLYTTGRLDEAARAFGKAIADSASDSLTARLNLGILHHSRGEEAEATRQFERVMLTFEKRAAGLSAAELTAAGTAARFLGDQDPQLFKEAVRAFEAAIAADTGAPEPRVRLGELFLEKYNSADAAEVFDEVLRVNPSHPLALLGMARRLQFDGAPGAAELTRRSLEVNPNLTSARVFMAMLNLESEDYTQATAEAERALEVNPASLEALSVLAATRYMQGDRAEFEKTRRQVLALNPRFAELYSIVAELSAKNRLYREAVDLARQAVALDPESWRAVGLLGMNQLRVGAVDEARKNLEIAFAGDPYHVWIKNTLDLLDTFANYRETRTRRFQLIIDGKESELLSLYVGELAEEAYDRLVARYGFRPNVPVRLELYRSHADFSVRTVGLAGLGALGVSFGNVLAMDSPAAREVGEFNWGSTLWHEVAHAFTLGMTEHRVPRWLSEGISVYEERRAKPGWGADATLGFLAAYKGGGLPPVSRLNDGFTRPQYPEQIMFAYYQASLVCELIEREWGPRALVDMLHGYRHGLTTAQVLQRVLGTDPASLDRRFDQYMRERFARPLAAIRVKHERDTSGTAVRTTPVPAPSLEGATSTGQPDRDDFVAQLTAGRALFEAGNRDEARPYFERAKELFPEYAEENSPYWYLALIHKERGELRQAAAELERLTAIDEDNYRANLEQADLLEKLGNSAGAAAALERAIYIFPFEIPLHTRLAGLYAAVGAMDKVIRERRALVALDPVDRADALYQLALAYHKAGNPQAARREVLRALEEAPSFERAQELLLNLQGGTDRSSTEQP